MRTTEKATFLQNEADLKQGVGGIQMALKVLNDYYSQASAGGSKDSSTAIIALLETAESDMSKDLAELTTIENNAVMEYEAQTKENEVTRATKMQDEKYKAKE